MAILEHSLNSGFLPPFSFVTRRVEHIVHQCYATRPLLCQHHLVFLWVDQEPDITRCTCLIDDPSGVTLSEYPSALSSTIDIYTISEGWTEG